MPRRARDVQPPSPGQMTDLWRDRLAVRSYDPDPYASAFGAHEADVMAAYGIQADPLDVAAAGVAMVQMPMELPDTGYRRMSRATMAAMTDQALRRLP